MIVTNNIGPAVYRLTTIGKTGYLFKQNVHGTLSSLGIELGT